MKPPTDADPKARGISVLDEYAMGRWECVLHYMVGSQQQEVISSDALQILQHAGLMKKYMHKFWILQNCYYKPFLFREPGENQLSITKDGFQFLLMDTSAQVWYFLLQYLDTATARGLDLIDCLGFLFQLSFSTLGQVHNNSENKH